VRTIPCFVVTAASPSQQIKGKARFHRPWQLPLPAGGKNPSKGFPAWLGWGPANPSPRLVGGGIPFIPDFFQFRKEKIIGPELPFQGWPGPGIGAGRFSNQTLPVPNWFQLEGTASGPSLGPGANLVSQGGPRVYLDPYAVFFSPRGKILTHHVLAKLALGWSSHWPWENRAGISHLGGPEKGEPTFRVFQPFNLSRVRVPKFFPWGQENPRLTLGPGGTENGVDSRGFPPQGFFGAPG